MRMPEMAAYAPVPGPVNRESFLDAQSRHRRASWRFTALSALAIGLMGIPLSAVISPLLYAAAMLAVDLVNLVVAMPDPLAALASDSGSSAPLPPETIALIGAAIVVPGSVVLLLAWLGVRRLFKRAGSGATVLALGARPPGESLEEQQVVNVVGEMAAAAGVPAPKVMLLDSPVANAAAVGSRMDNCTVVVTTGLLESLDRAETQAVVAHVVASVGNGDLRIGATLSSVFATLGLVGSVLRAPSEGRPRVTLRRLLRYAFGRRGADDAAALTEVLAQATTEDPDHGEKEPGGFKSMVLLPFVVAGMAFQLTAMIFGFLVVNPLLRRAWRARRHLADATAVRLTRDPGALARGLVALGTSGGVVPGTEWAAHLFAAGAADPNAGNDGTRPMPTFQPKLADRVARLRGLGADVPEVGHAQTPAQRRILAVVLLVSSPCWLSFVGLMIGAALLLTGVSLMIDSLFLAPMVALAHVALRGLAG